MYILIDKKIGLVPFDLYLETLPKSLRVLSLRMTNLVLPSGLDLIELDLDSLTLDKCNYPERLETSFNRIFRAKRIVIMGFFYRFQLQLMNKKKR